jgi:hypothetical protein
MAMSGNRPEVVRKSSGAQVQWKVSPYRRRHAFGGKKGYTVPSAAERFLLKQFKWWKNEYLARIDFADGDAERIFELGKARSVFGAGADEDESEDESED